MKAGVTLTGKFNFLCWLICIVKHVASQPSINFVETATLQPPPYRLDDSYLQLMSFKERKTLCRKMFGELQSISPPPVPISVLAVFLHAPKAHVYKFDDEEEWLSIRCAGLPPFYVSHEKTKLSDHHWHIRIVKPAMETYEFRFETCFNVLDNLRAKQTTAQLPPETHYFHQMDTLKRWYLCSEARHMIDYPVEAFNRDLLERPRIQTFQYMQYSWEEQYLTFKCPGEPVIYLRTGDSTKETNVIWIVLLEEDEDGDDDDDEDDSGTDSDNTEIHTRTHLDIDDID